MSAHRNDAARWFAVMAAVTLCASGRAEAEELESDAVYIPVPTAVSLVVRNPLGAVSVQGWDRPEVRIVAHKHANAAGARSLIGRLKVRVDFNAGHVRVTTGFYLSDGTFNPLPLSSAGIDLSIDAPRAMALQVATFRGDIRAAGFRLGATLSSEIGEIQVADVAGPVETRALDGNQWIEEVRGSLAANAVTGDLDLARIEGPRVEAKVVRGRITVRDVRSALVRLRAQMGDIVFVGALVPATRYDFATHRGDVVLRLRPASFRVVARSPRGVVGDLRLALQQQDATGLQRGRHVESPGHSGSFDAEAALLDLASIDGDVRISTLK